MKTLAKIDVGEGREAAILQRDDGTTCWTTELGSSETSDEHLMVHVPAGTLVAGEAPRGKGTVHVSDAAQTIVAGGMFLALIADQREQAVVVVLEEANAPVPPEDELKRTPLDVEARCPRCEWLSWDRVEWRAPLDESRARLRALVCRRCGYYENPELLGRRRQPETDYEMDPSPLPEEPTAEELLDGASFPVYALAAPKGRRARLREHGWRPGLMTSIMLAFGSTAVEVKLASEHSRSTPLERARNKLESALDSDLLDQMSREARGLDNDVFWLKHSEGKRALKAAVDAAPTRSVPLPVEDRPVEFALLEHAGVWAASAQVDDHHITIVGRRVAPEKIALRRLTPEDELG